MSRGQQSRKIIKPSHELPGEFWLDYILLPYGEYYAKSQEVIKASSGDTLRFFNGPDVTIDSIVVLDEAKVIDIMCRMRYGVSWDKAFAVWLRYARMEGHDRGILDEHKCILVTFNAEDKL